MSRLAIASSILVLCSGMAVAEGHDAISGYALAGDGSRLLTMADISDPGAIAAVDLSEALAAIAWRPVTGDLLGFADGAIYSVDAATGEMTDLSATFVDEASIGSGAAVALDFNNQIDALRAVSTAGENLVYFPDGFGDGDERAGSVRRFTDLAYADGDAMAGTTPEVFANAYTNAINGQTAASTFQYALDAETDTLISLANNAGTLETIAKITVDGAEVDLAPMGGFDIVSPQEGEDRAYAVLQVADAKTAGLYAIELTTGEATMLADLGVGGISSFAAALGR
ncbi:MAG: DUF4394 domain-containing protein [Pseudomonadota bacterium]